MSTVNAGRPMLPIDPIRDAVIHDARRLWNASECSMYLPEGKYPGLAILANQTGIGERALRRWVDGESQHADENAVDRYCIATGRHLIDLYPELYEDLSPADDEADDIFSGQCKGCPSSRLRIVRERPTRLWLRCVECDRGQYVEHPRARTSGRRRRFTDEQGQEMRRLYEAGWTTERIGEAYSASHSVISDALQRAGAVMRPQTPPRNPNPHVHPSFAARTAERVARGEELSWAAGKLRLEGLSHSQIGARLGFTRTGIAKALERLDERFPDWREQLGQRRAEAA